MASLAQITLISKSSPEDFFLSSRIFPYNHQNYFLKHTMDILISLGAIILGLALLTVGGNLLVDGAVSIAKKW